MKSRLLELIVCPACGKGLKCRTWEESDGETMDGLLQCKTGHGYPIIGGIPRLVLPALRIGPVHEQWKKLHRAKLEDLSIEIHPAPIPADSAKFQSLQADVIEKFDFEWEAYDRFGWDDPMFNIEREEAVFAQKTMLQPDDLKGKLTLDAGCGNGRYTYWAAQYGAEVIGMELGSAIETAYANTRSLPNVHLVQGDIFSLPFKTTLFEVIFAIGVLQHTGDAKRAFANLSNRLMSGGNLSVIVYGKGNRIFEWSVNALRRKTTPMPIPRLMRISQTAYKFAGFLETIKMLRFVNRFVYLENHPHLIFNRYSVPVATTHSFEEVEGWFRELDFKVIESNYAMRGKFPDSDWLRAASSVAMRGLKPD